MAKIKVAVIGLGGMGGAQMELLKNSRYVKELMGCEIDDERAGHYSSQHNIEVVKRFKDIIARKDIDLVYITVPGVLHADFACAAMEAGKSVMCEKPMAINLTDCERMVDVRNRTKAFLQIGFEMHYSKLYTRCKEIIDSGEIGEVKNLLCIYQVAPYPKSGMHGDRDISWKFKKEKSGGLFCEKLCHYIDLARWHIGGRVKTMYCTAAPNTLPYYTIHDNTHCTCTFDNGARSHMTFMMQPSHYDYDPMFMGGRNDIGQKCFHVIVGTKGALEANVFWRQLRVFRHAGHPDENSGTMTRVESWLPDQDQIYFHNTIDQNLDIVKRVAENLPPYTDPEDSLETMRLCFEAEEAMDGNGLVER